MENLTLTQESTNRTLEGVIGANKESYTFNFALNQLPQQINFTAVTTADNLMILLGSYDVNSKQFTPSVMKSQGFDWSLLGQILTRCEGIVAEFNAGE